MATYTLQTPSKPSFPSQNVRTKGLFWQGVELLEREYDKDLKFIETNCKIPSEILISLLLAISYSNPPAPRPQANAGLLGWELAYGAPVGGKRLNAKVVLNYEKAKARMTANEEAKLKAFGLTYAKASGTSLAPATGTNGFQEITTALQWNSAFNLLFGAIFLGQLMDSKGYGLDTYPNWAVDDSSNLHLERIIVVFLNGADTSRDSVKKALSRNYTNALTLMEAIKPTDPFSADIINRVLGTGGYLDQIVNDYRSNGLRYSASKFKFA
jgi:hypothetical protein